MLARLRLYCCARIRSLLPAFLADGSNDFPGGIAQAFEHFFVVAHLVAGDNVT
jgi:hypothetical protein